MSRYLHLAVTVALLLLAGSSVVKGDFFSSFLRLIMDNPPPAPEEYMVHILTNCKPQTLAGGAIGGGIAGAAGGPPGAALGAAGGALGGCVAEHIGEMIEN